MDHERDELGERRRRRLSPAGKDLLAELERLEATLEPPSEEMLGRIATLAPEERAEIAAFFGGKAQEIAARQREYLQGAAQAASLLDVLREAEERERAAGRAVDPNMTVGDALKILGRQ